MPAWIAASMIFEWVAEEAALTLETVSDGASPENREALATAVIARITALSA